MIFKNNQAIQNWPKNRDRIFFENGKTTEQKINLIQVEREVRTYITRNDNVIQL